MKKNPILAAILNFALFGGGTIYIGRRVLVGIILTISLTAVQVVEILVSPLGKNAIPSLWPFFIGGMVVTKIALAIDGYREAKQ